MACMTWCARVGVVLALLCSCIMLSFTQWQGESSATVTHNTERVETHSVTTAKASSRHWAARFSDFHCQRNFDALATMTSLAKANRAQNCNFTYFSVEAAWADVQCSHVYAEATISGGDEHSDAERDKSESSSCNVTLHVRLRIAADVRQRLLRQMGSVRDYAAILRVQDTATNDTRTVEEPKSHASAQRERQNDDNAVVIERNDPWRFTLQLRARGESTVHYKGYDGAGYSVCCELLLQHQQHTTRERGANTEDKSRSWCEWLHAERGDYDHDVDDTSPAYVPPDRVIRACPLPILLPTADGLPPPSHEDEEEQSEETMTGYERTIEGQISKPLHRYVPGAWQVRLQLMRRRSAYHVWLAGQDDDSSAATAEVNQQHNSTTNDGVSETNEDENDLEVLGRIVVPFVLSRIESSRSSSSSSAKHAPHEHAYNDNGYKASAAVTHSEAHAQATSSVQQDDL